MEFRCKEFELNHSRSSMKVGTDAMLLSALTPAFDTKKILDIGTGCGIVALCMAQTFKQADIVAIDIDQESILETTMNFANSRFKDRLKAIHISLHEFAQSSSEKFDLIVSNPPFFENSLLSNKLKRNISRHNVNLTLENLASSVANLLSSKGNFVVILPESETMKLITLSTNYDLFCYSQYLVFDKANKPCKRIISQLSKQKLDTDIARHNIILRNQDNTYTETYRNLTFPFLL